MSYVRFVIRDFHRDIYADRHGSDANRTIAALSAEPETIEELEAALERFMEPTEGGFFRRFSKGIDDQPYDAGIVVIDLAARLIVCESSYSTASSQGCVNYHDGRSATDIGIRYHLSEDWAIRHNALHWRTLADERRRRQLANPPLDVRAILYGKALLEYIARKCYESATGHLSVGHGEDDAKFGIVRQIHADWLTEPRADLRDQAPRDVMIAKKSFIDWDLQHRCEQWSRQGRCPPGVDEQSHAFKFAGFGTHELVCYYDMVRFLVRSCARNVTLQAKNSHGAPQYSIAASASDFLAVEVPRLTRLRNQWLDEPNMDFSGHVPREIIAHERARLPEGMSGHEAMIDCDCPLCQMQADLPGPVFWHLDGCNMDDDFAFSFHRTRDLWEAEQREYAEFNKRFEDLQDERKRLGVEYPGTGYADPDCEWERSFSSQASSAQSLLMRLFAVGSHLCEIIVDLKLANDNRPLIERLSRDFGNLREVVLAPDIENAAALFEPVMQNFCNALSDVASEIPQSADKCAELQKRLQCFMGPQKSHDGLGEAESDDMGLPF